MVNGNAAADSAKNANVLTYTQRFIVKTTIFMININCRYVIWI